MNDQYYDDFDRGFDAGEEEAGWRADRYIAKLEDELNNQSYSSALTTHARVLEEREAELEAQVQQIEASRDQLADDFKTVCVSLDLAVKGLEPFVKALEIERTARKALGSEQIDFFNLPGVPMPFVNAEILYLQGVTVLGEMRASGYGWAFTDDEEE